FTVIDGGLPALDWRCHQIPSSAPASAACSPDASVPVAAEARSATDACTARTLPSTNRNVTSDRTMTRAWPSSSRSILRMRFIDGPSPQPRGRADRLRQRLAGRAGQDEVEPQGPVAAGIPLGAPGAARHVPGEVPRPGPAQALQDERAIGGNARGRGSEADARSALE